MAKHDSPSRGIFLRGKKYWLTWQHNGKRIKTRLDTADFSEAVIRATAIRSDPEMVSSAEGMAADIERFIRWKLNQGEYTRSTELSKGYVIKAFAAWLGEYSRTAAVTTANVQAYYTALRARRIEPSASGAAVDRTRSITTCNGYYNTLRSFFRWAVKVDRSIRHNPCDGVKLAKEPGRARLNFCTVAQRDKLISECAREDLRFVLYCGFHAGMRFQEIVEARPFWFDMEGRLINLRRTDTMRFKDGEERSVPMTAAFHAFLSQYGMRDPFMLRPEVTHGKSIYRYDFERPFTAYMKAQGLPWVTPHIMRHTFASLLASAGVSIFLIAEWLGDDVRVVQRHYAKLLPLHHEIERAFPATAPKPAGQRNGRGRAGRTA